MCSAHRPAGHPVRRELGLGQTLFFHDLTDLVVRRFGPAFPELSERQTFIREVIRGEEKRFGETRDRGLALLDKELARLQDGQQLDGEVVRLHDTYGFPSDLTALIASKRGTGRGRGGLRRSDEPAEGDGPGRMEGVRLAGAEKLWHDLLAEHGDTSFTGYDSLDGAGRVLALVQNGSPVDQIAAGEKGIVLTDTTPSTASGGQMGDVGTLAGAVVTDTQKPLPDLIAHHIEAGPVAIGVGDTVTLSVGGAKRDGSRRNHTATHLLQAALKQVLGDHVAQKGRSVGPTAFGSTSRTTRA